MGNPYVSRRNGYLTSLLEPPTLNVSLPMKKILGLSLLAAFVFLATERPAQAWIDCKWSVGLNWHWQSGGNNLLWGLYRNGQVPGPWGDGLIPGLQPAPPNGPVPYCGPGPYGGAAPAGPDAYPYYGAPPAPNAAPPAVPAARTSGQQAWHFGTIPNWSAPQNGYQQTGYYQNPASYYPNYNYSGYDYSGYNYPGYYGVPSYWYGQ
jgi:hypothetical protein